MLISENLWNKNQQRILAMNSTKQVKGIEEPVEDQWICQIIVGEGVLGVLGNLLVCFVILRVQFLHNVTNYLLVNLAVADMLLCLQGFVLYLTASSKCTLIAFVPSSIGERTVFCRILASSFLGWALSHASAYNLCVVTLERYVAIVHPLHYARKLTTTRMKMLIALIWVVSFLFSLPFLFTNEPTNDPAQACTGIQYPNQAFPILVSITSFLTAYLLPTTLMSLAYYKIQVTLKRQAKALNLQHARAAAYDLVIARQHLISMLTIILGALIILWTPSYLTTLLCLHKSHEAPFPFCDSTTFNYISGITAFAYYLNSVINPIIYEFKYKKFREGLRAAFSCCFKKHGNNRVGIQLVPL